MIQVRTVASCVFFILFAVSVPLSAAQGVINVNTATKEEFMMLPGIGEKTASTIVDYRQTNGQFKSIDDMEKVKGISKKKLNKLRPNLVLTGPSTYIPSQTSSKDKKKNSKKKS
jgi:competence protein ComEA